MSSIRPSTVTGRSRLSHYAFAGAIAGLFLGSPPAANAQSSVRYEISFPNRAHHEAEVRVHYRDVPPGTLELRMSRTSPGRYALHEFAKNVYNFRARDGAGRSLEVHRPDPHQWDVSGHGGEVVVTYTLFGDRADGTYSGIDQSHAHLNAPATFLWARGLGARAVELVVTVPEGSGWRVATQLRPTNDPTVFTAPDVDYFLDSPVEVSDFGLREWSEAGQTIRIAMHHTGTDAELDRYFADAQAIVREQIGIFGELPEFDFGTYTFLACYLPWAAGDGMEHRNSTVLTSTSSLATNATGLLGTVAHEFFHAWSIERIRPRSLEPFDFEHANMSRELWFGEGFTSYYDDLSMVRAGVIDVPTFAQRMGGAIDAVTNAPGRGFFSPVEMSMQAPFVDAAVSVDPVNRANTFVSYYTWGSVVALGLDLALRTEYPGVTLDDLMREMWARHGSPERPYSVEDIETALAEVTGDGSFATSFFDAFVRGRDVPPFEALLAASGIQLRKRSPGTALFAGVPLTPGNGGLVVSGNALIGTPLYAAGADRGDVLLTLDGRPLDGTTALAEAMRGKAPGSTIEVAYRSRGVTRTATVRLVEDPALEAVPLEEAGARPSAAQAAFRRAWLGPSDD